MGKIIEMYPSETIKGLKEWRKSIKKEIPYIDIKPYSHNIVSISLQAIAKEYGKQEADKAINDFNLEQFGWKKEKEKEK